MGVSQSSLSHIIRDLETRLGIRLLTRTTRSVSPTDAGERLLNTVGPRLEEVEDELNSLREPRKHPSGTIRITSTDYATDTILWPKIMPLLRKYPDINLAEPHLAKKRLKHTVYLPGEIAMGYAA